MFDGFVEVESKVVLKQRVATRREEGCAKSYAGMHAYANYIDVQQQLVYSDTCPPT